MQADEAGDIYELDALLEPTEVSTLSFCFEKLVGEVANTEHLFREAQEWFVVPGMQHSSCSQAIKILDQNALCPSAEFPRTLSRVSVSRKDSTACFSAHTWKATFLFCGAHDPESDFTSPVPTEKQTNTEHDHGVETRTASIYTRSQDRADWSNHLFVDMDSGVGSVMQSLGGVDSSAVRLQSNLDEPDDRDFADTQHAPLSNTCDESETLVGAALARSVLQQEAAQ